MIYLLAYLGGLYIGAFIAKQYGYEPTTRFLYGLIWPISLVLIILHEVYETFFGE